MVEMLGGLKEVNRAGEAGFGENMAFSCPRHARDVERSSEGQE